MAIIFKRSGIRVVERKGKSTFYPYYTNEGRKTDEEIEIIKRKAITHNEYTKSSIYASFTRVTYTQCPILTVYSHGKNTEGKPFIKQAQVTKKRNFDEAWTRAVKRYRQQTKCSNKKIQYMNDLKPTFDEMKKKMIEFNHKEKDKEQYPLKKLKWAFGKVKNIK